MPMHRLEHAKFPRHVVGFEGYRAQWPTPQHILVTIYPQQICKVGVTVGKLLPRNPAVNHFDFSSQEIGQGRKIEFFACPNRSGVAMH